MMMVMFIVLLMMVMVIVSSMMLLLMIVVVMAIVILLLSPVLLMMMVMFIVLLMMVMVIVSSMMMLLMIVVVMVVVKVIGISREKPQTSVNIKPSDTDVLDKSDEDMSSGFLGLPEEENELDVSTFQYLSRRHKSANFSYSDLDEDNEDFDW